MACAAWRIPSLPLVTVMTAGGHNVLRHAGHPSLQILMQPVDLNGLLLHANSEWEWACGRTTFISRWENPVSLFKMVLVSKCRG